MRWALALLVLLGWHAALAQEQKRDTIPMRHVEEVAIPASRLRPSLEALASRFTTDLSRALAQSSEIYMRQYGPTGASSISLNGLGAAQTALEWNGIPLNSPLLGQADANQFAAAGAQINRNGSSAFAATQAATLGLTTARPDSGQYLRLGGQLGAYGLAGASGSVGMRKKRWAALGQCQWNEARNDYRVADPTTRDRRRFPLPNARGFRRQAEGHLWYSGRSLSTNVHAFAALWGRHLAPSTQSLQRETNESLYGRNSAFTVSEIYDKGRDSVRAQYALSAEDYRYAYPAGQPPPERFAFTRQQASAGYYRRWTSARTGLAYEAVKEQTPDLPSLGRQNRYLHFFTPSFLWKAQQLSLGGVLYGQKLYFVPSLTVGWKGFQVLMRRTFRPPTFNDLYYPVYGQPHLKPERALHVEASFTKTIYSANSWLIGTQNRVGQYRFSNYIQWLPVSNLYQPNNLVNIKNMYINTKFMISKILNNTKLELVNNVSFTKIGIGNGVIAWPGKQLTYSPILQNTTTASVLVKKWQLELWGKYAGRRYFTSDNSIRNSLDQFYLANLRVAYTATLNHLQLTGFATFGNLFGTEYAYIQDYPMPRYEAALGLQIEIRR